MIYSILLLMAAILQLVLSTQVIPINWMDSTASTKQMIIQLIIYILAYAMLVLTDYVTPKPASIIIQSFYLGFLICKVIELSRQAIKENNIPVKAATAKPLLKIVVFTWMGLFSTLCCVNHILVSITPEAYSGVAELSFCERAFVVVYYTFSIMFTYTGNGIAPIGMIPKAFEMVEVLLCFFVIGIVFTNIISKVAETTPETDNKQKVKKKK